MYIEKTHLKARKKFFKMNTKHTRKTTEKFKYKYDLKKIIVESLSLVKRLCKLIVLDMSD